MRIAFFGTPSWAVPSLTALVRSGAEVVAVVTNPDRPAGRGMEVRASPVKQTALEAGIEVLQPSSVKDEAFAERLRALELDVAVVVAYGKILPGSLLDIPRLGFVNVHFSVLPAYRGAAPVQWALMDGLDRTGVSIMVLTEGMDEGPVLSTTEVDIASDDTAETLGLRLAEVGASTLVPTLDAYGREELEAVEQDHSRATRAHKITSTEARVAWDAPAESIRNLVRGLNPEPGAWTSLRGERLKLFRVAVDPAGRLLPGMLEASSGALMVGAGEGSIEVVEAQLAGKKRMTGAELARGLRVAQGERFE